MGVNTHLPPLPRNKLLFGSAVVVDNNDGELMMMMMLICGGAGPFQQLNAEAIEQELGDMSRALYKLSKAFSDQPAPRNVADRVRRQIEKFKANQALLNVICNPGIRDRHWKKVANVLFIRTSRMLLLI